MRAEPAGYPIVAEPRSRYAPYPPIVVDCSVLAGKELFAPDLLDHELVSVALKKSGAGLTTIAEQALEDLAQLRLTRCAVNGRAQFDLARKLDLTAYDAAYVLLAADLGAPLVTFDRTLGLAAQKFLQGKAHR